MGTDRKQHQKQSTAKVSKKLSAEFDVNFILLYNVWKHYNVKKLMDSKPNAIALTKHNLYKQGNVFDYLICFALETINMEMIKEITDGKKTIN